MLIKITLFWFGIFMCIASVLEVKEIRVLFYISLAAMSFFTLIILKEFEKK